MGLPARQRKVLERIESTLRGSDPRLAALYAIFSRLTRDEEMPRIEQVRYGIRRIAARIGHISVGMSARTHLRLVPKQPGVLLFPLAIALAAVTIVLAARSGPACMPVRQGGATAQAFAKTSPCRPTSSLNNLYGH